MKLPFEWVAKVSSMLASNGFNREEALHLEKALSNPGQQVLFDLRRSAVVGIDDDGEGPHPAVRQKHPATNTACPSEVTCFDEYRLPF